MCKHVAGKQYVNRHYPASKSRMLIQIIHSYIRHTKCVHLATLALLIGKPGPTLQTSYKVKAFWCKMRTSADAKGSD